jgi:hypothetical protein
MAPPHRIAEIATAFTVDESCEQHACGYLAPFGAVIHKAADSRHGDIGDSDDAFRGACLEVGPYVASAARFAGRAIDRYPLAF